MSEYKMISSLDQHFSLKQNRFYKRFSLVLLLAIIALLAPVTGDAASCWKDRGGYYHDTLEVNFQSLSDDAGTVDSCSGLILQSAQEYAVMKTKADMAETVQIDPFDIAESFTWGFGTYLTFWWLSFCIKTARMTIKKL